MAKLKWKGSRSELYRSLKLIPAVLAGTRPDMLGIAPVFWGSVGNAVLALVRDAFLVKMDGGQGSDGVTWAKLAVATLVRKRRLPLRGKPQDILQETGALLDSLMPGQGEFPSGAVNQVFAIEAGKVTVGTADFKADSHQEGTDWMPARPIVPDSDADLPLPWEAPIEEAMVAALERVIETVVKSGGIP